MSAYRSNPQEYLTKIACRKALSGDANLILKIHDFLERRSVINFYFSSHGEEHFETGSRPRQVTPPPGPVPAPDPEPYLFFSSIKVLSKNLRPFCDLCGLSCHLFWFVRDSENACLACLKAMTPAQAQGYVKHDINNKGVEPSRAQRNPWTIE